MARAKPSAQRPPTSPGTCPSNCCRPMGARTLPQMAAEHRWTTFADAGRRCLMRAGRCWLILADVGRCPALLLCSAATLLLLLACWPCRLCWLVHWHPRPPLPPLDTLPQADGQGVLLAERRAWTLGPQAGMLTMPFHDHCVLRCCCAMPCLSISLLCFLLVQEQYCYLCMLALRCSYSSIGNPRASHVLLL